MTPTERRALVAALQCLTAPTMRQESQARTLARELLEMLHDADAAEQQRRDEAREYVAELDAQWLGRAVAERAAARTGDIDGEIKPGAVGQWP